MSSLSKLSLALVALNAGHAQAGITIEPMKHNIQQITPGNFDGVISKFRASSVASMWCFHENEKADKDFLDTYDQVATKMKGMAKITAINCDSHAAFCKDCESTKDGPSVKIFPPNPMPPFMYEGDMTADGIMKKVNRLIPDMTTRLSKANVDTWMSSEPSKPKVMLFTDKKGTPTIFKALSSETVFQRSIRFGIVSHEEADLVKRFKVSKFPSIVRSMVGKDQELYKGEMSFGPLKEWVGVYSESGMGDTVKSSGAASEDIEDAKPWLVQEVPELTGKSHNDICFKGEGLCVIYLKDGDLSQDETDMLTGLKNQFTSQISDRGAKLKWMWINLAVESEYKTLFEPAQLPSAVVFNPHKRLRFVKMDHGEDNDVKGDETAISKLLDKVLGGDGRFKMVPGGKLPAWATRTPPAAGKKTEL